MNLIIIPVNELPNVVEVSIAFSNEKVSQYIEIDGKKVNAENLYYDSSSNTLLILESIIELSSLLNISSIEKSELLLLLKDYLYNIEKNTVSLRCITNEDNTFTPILQELKVELPRGTDLPFAYTMEEFKELQSTNTIL